MRCLGFSFAGNKQDIVHNDGETMSVGSTRTDELAHQHAPGSLIDDTPEIHSDFKNLLLVHPTEVLHGKKKKASTSRCICTTQTQNSLVSAHGVLSLVDRYKLEHAELITKAGQTSVSTEHVTLL